MPATRRRYFPHGANSYQDDRRVDDIETGNLGPNRARFRDVVNATINRKRCQDIKKQLLAGPGRHTFEKFRMSDDELKTIKSKPVRRFYEKQNEKLDDWLEVDTLVLALADDVLDSMHPEDLDHDGVHERGGPLRDTNESTNSRVKYFGIGTTMLLVGLWGWQIMYLRAYFRSKHLI